MRKHYSIPSYRHLLQTAVLALLLYTPLQAAQINVDSLLDNGNAGDGLCTLREAVLAADLNIPVDSCTAGSGIVTDNILLAPSLFPLPLRLGVINLTNSLNIVDNSLRILVPANSSLSLIGDDAHPVLTLEQNLGATFSLNNTLIRDGFNATAGGGIAILGGTATVTLTNVTVTDNVSQDVGGGIGIVSDDPLIVTMTDSAVTSNQASSHGGGIASLVAADVELNLINTEVSLNSADGSGGGVYMIIPSGTADIVAWLRVEQARIAGNTSVGAGGGIQFNRSNNTTNRAIISVLDSTFVDNQATGELAVGGGLGAFGQRSDALSRIELRRSSFVNNTAAGSGGGFYIASLRAAVTNNSVIGNVGGTTGGAVLSYQSAEGAYAVALVGNSFHYNTGGGGTGSSAAWDLFISYPPFAGSAVRYVGNVINNEVTAPGDAPCRLTTLPAGISFIGGYNRIRDTNFASVCVEDANDQVLPDLGVALTAVADPIHEVALIPQAGSPLIDVWPSGACVADGGALLDLHMLGLRRVGGAPLNGDPQTIAGCDSGAIEAAEGRLLTVLLAGTGVGQVSSNPAAIDCGSDCVAAFPLDSMVTLSAASSPGSSFFGWSGDCTGTSDCMLTMSQARNVSAQFDLDLSTFAVSVTLPGSGNGSVNSTPSGISCAPNCSADFVENTVLTLQANPAAGQLFIGWGGDCVGAGTATVCQLTITADQNVSATFEPQLHDLSVVIDGDGAGVVQSTPVGIGCPGDCTESFPAGTLVILDAAVAAGSSFVGWSGACSGTALCSFTMDQPRSVTASFELQPDALFSNGFE